uniref:MADS-box protein 18 n=1 Tax=Ginkgo biloba TaxID=3311 RepID=A0A7T5VA87_GINBI|nr:MADS-box protein 18 [Ginkgo biloba]QQG64140.1 MADS-box protein 18 [Ginkgo biloba]
MSLVGKSPFPSAEEGFSRRLMNFQYYALLKLHSSFSLAQENILSTQAQVAVILSKYKRFQERGMDIVSLFGICCAHFAVKLQVYDTFMSSEMDFVLACNNLIPVILICYKSSRSFRQKILFE